MKKFEYKHKRYVVKAKRKDRKENWTDWTIVDDYAEAVKHCNHAKEVGYDAIIIDKGEKK